MTWKPDDEPTVREREMVNAMIEGTSIAGAGRAVGWSRESARHHWKKPNVRNYYRELLVKAGLDDDTLASKLLELTTTDRFGIAPDGTRVNLGPDGTTRVKAVEMAFKLSDAFPNPKLDIDHKVSGAILIQPGDLLGVPDPFAAMIDGESREIEETETPGEESGV